MSSRDTDIAAFLAEHGWADAERRTLADDASFRRYDRITESTRTAVLMDAPPAKEDVRPFLNVATALHELGLSAPKILAERPEDGLLLLEDFGDNTYTRVLNESPDQEEALYMLAADLLIALHKRFASKQTLPRYDDALLTIEANLLIDWYLPAITGAPIADTLRQEYEALWQALFAQIRDIPETLVLRDYHVDNLVWLPGRSGIAACGLLDFQDAVLGPTAYDLVSLLEDARRDVPPALAQQAVAHYLAAFPDVVYHEAARVLSLPNAAPPKGVGRICVVGADLLMRIVVGYGTAAIAAYGVALRCQMLLLIPGFALGNAVSTIVGQNIGAGKPERAERGEWLGAAINAVFMAIAGGVNGFYGSKVQIILDDDPARTFDVGFVSWGAFVGVVDTAGFNTFEFRELDGKVGQMLFVPA